MIGINDACEILSWAYNNNIEIWLDGGWGVDALLGKETRQHNDIDLFVEEKNYNKFIEIIKNKGFNEIVVEYTSEVHTIWSDNKLRIIDLHVSIASSVVFPAPFSPMRCQRAFWCIVQWISSSTVLGS